MKAHNLLVFILILLISIFMNFYKVERFPICLSNDEAAFSYNAFSILSTGKDEYGKNFPLLFTSIGDAKLPLTIYLTTIPIKLFGLNEWSIRTPSALFGVIAVVAIYILTLKISNSHLAAASAALILGISPWHLVHSRSLFDANISFTFNLLAVLFFILGLKRHKYMFLSPLFFASAIYTYYSDRLFVPLMLGGLIFIFRSKIKIIVPQLGLFLLLIIPLIVTLLFSPVDRNKLTISTIFSLPAQDLISTEALSNRFIYHSYPLRIGYAIARRYFNHFAPSFLFLSGTSQDLKQMVYGLGQLHIFQLPLIVFGLLSLRKLDPRLKKVILLWLFLGPIPAAITRDEVHGRRALEMLTPLSIISGLGVVYLATLLKSLSKLKRATLIFSFFSLVSYCLFLFSLSFTIFTPLRSYKAPAGWGCGYKELVNITTPIQNNYRKVVIDTTYQSPYLFFLFYQKYPPQKYQPQAKLTFEPGHNLGESPGYDNLEFRQVFWPDDRGQIGYLFAAPPEKIPSQDIDAKNHHLIGTVQFPNGETAFNIVEVKP